VEAERAESDDSSPFLIKSYKINGLNQARFLSTHSTVCSHQGAISSDYRLPSLQVRKCMLWQLSSFKGVGRKTRSESFLKQNCIVLFYSPPHPTPDYRVPFCINPPDGVCRLRVGSACQVSLVRLLESRHLPNVSSSYLQGTSLPGSLRRSSQILPRACPRPLGPFPRDLPSCCPPDSGSIEA
jgi:hypothetical protein